MQPIQDAFDVRREAAHSVGEPFSTIVQSAQQRTRLSVRGLSAMIVQWKRSSHLTTLANRHIVFMQGATKRYMGERHAFSSNYGLLRIVEIRATVSSGLL